MSLWIADLVTLVVEMAQARTVGVVRVDTEEGRAHSQIAAYVVEAQPEADIE